MQFRPMKGDERILGGSAFVNQILSEAEVYFERRHYLKTVGINLDSVHPEMRYFVKGQPQRCIKFEFKTF